MNKAQGQGLEEQERVGEEQSNTAETRRNTTSHHSSHFVIHWAQIMGIKQPTQGVAQSFLCFLSPGLVNISNKYLVTLNYHCKSSP